MLTDQYILANGQKHKSGLIFDPLKMSLFTFVKDN